ncbi:hypothetical protein ACJZ2D_002805 [Fusarium nematophilum]
MGEMIFAAVFWEMANKSCAEFDGGSSLAPRDFRMTEVLRQADMMDWIDNSAEQTWPAHSDIFRIVEPDYRRSEARLYQDIVTSGITHYNSLYCITMGGVGTFEGAPSLNHPSWVPDFRRIGNLEIPYSRPIFMQHGQAGIYKEQFKAIFPPQLLIEPGDPMSLWSDLNWEAQRDLASGFMLCVGQASLDHYFAEKFNSQYAARRREEQNPTMAEGYRPSRPRGDPALSYMTCAFYEHFITDVSQRDDAVAHKAICDQLYEQAAPAFGSRITKEGSDTREPLLIPFHEVVDDLSMRSSIRKFRQSLDSLWEERPGTRVGDEVCILYGCPTPLVIRPDEGVYLLIGDYCFKGMIRGEIVKRQEEGEFVLQNFVFK